MVEVALAGKPGVPVPALLSGERGRCCPRPPRRCRTSCFTRYSPPCRRWRFPCVALLSAAQQLPCACTALAWRAMPWGESPQQIRVLAKIEEWSRSTRSGDLSELTGPTTGRPSFPWVTSTRENCPGSHCPNAGLPREPGPPASHGRRLVVVNHHLVLPTWPCASRGWRELLPSVRVVVFDEAHQLSDAGLQFLGIQPSTGQFVEFARDALSAGLAHARGYADWPQLAANPGRRGSRWRHAAAMVLHPGKRGGAQGAP